MTHFCVSTSRVIPTSVVLNTPHTFLNLFYLSFPCSNICLPYLAIFSKSLFCIAQPIDTLVHSIYAQSHRPFYLLLLINLNQSQHCKMFSRMNVLKKTLSSAGVKMPKKYGNSATFLHGQLNINILSAENLPDLEST